MTEIDSTTKRCTVCGIFKQVTPQFFHRDKTTPDGFYPICKLCKNETNRVRDRAEKEQRPKLTCSDCGTPITLRAQHGLCRACHKAIEIQGRKEWYQKNKERILADRKIKYQDNIDQRREYSKQWYYLNREIALAKGTERRKKWAAENPDKMLQSVHRRRALRVNAPGNYTTDDIDCIFIEQGGCCAYCERPLEDTGYHIDHVIPLSKQGTNWPDNLALACPTCNVSKWDRTPDEWINRWYLK